MGATGRVSPRRTTIGRRPRTEGSGAGTYRNTPTASRGVGGSNPSNLANLDRCGVKKMLLRNGTFCPSTKENEQPPENGSEVGVSAISAVLLACVASKWRTEVVIGHLDVRANRL
jgi:hypothetical protein